MPRSINASRCSRGFTLVEAMVVMCILGLMASGAMVVLSGPMKRAKHQAVLAELADLDRWARMHSRRDAVKLRFDLRAQRIEAVAEVNTIAARVVNLPGGTRVNEVLVGAIAHDAGLVELTYHDGGGPTHAILVSSPSRKSTWTVVSGPTGQQFIVNNDENAAKELRNWFTKWTHPD